MPTDLEDIINIKEISEKYLYSCSFIPKCGTPADNYHLLPDLTEAQFKAKLKTLREKTWKNMGRTVSNKCRAFWDRYDGECETDEDLEQQLHLDSILKEL